MNEALRLRSLGVEERSLDAALDLGPALLGSASVGGEPWIAASLVSGPAIVLGAAQRACRVLDRDAADRAGVRVLRRATTGTAAYLGGRALVWTLALPSVAALVKDASPRTLLNRNVRGFLRGFRSAGAIAHYFGREWISVKHRPAALLGFEASESGAILMEVIAGMDEPLAIPIALAAEDERAIDRWQGKSPASLLEIVDAGIHSRIPYEFGRIVIENIAAHAGASLEPASLGPPPSPPSPSASPPQMSPRLPERAVLEPIPEGLIPAPPRRAPIGWIEAAASPPKAGEPRRAWLGGDVLAPTWALAEIAREAATGEPARPRRDEIALEGALWDDLIEAARSALSI